MAAYILTKFRAATSPTPKIVSLHCSNWVEGKRKPPTTQNITIASGQATPRREDPHASPMPRPRPR
jgi:hypothetical protein